MSIGRWATLVALTLFCEACGPDAVVDPTFTDGAGGRGGASDVRDTGPERSDSAGGTGGGGAGGGTGGTGGTAGTGGSGGGGGPADAPVDMALDQPIDQRVEPPDMMLTPDVVEAPPARMAVLVVANVMTPTAADMQLRTSLVGRGLTPRLVDDGAAADINADLVVIAASSDSVTLAMKYRAAAVPVLVIEPAAFDNMGMTTGANYGQDSGTQITITLAGHPMAAGLTGNVPVLTAAATLCWGVPAAAAEKVASFNGMAGRATIFGYPKGAAMVVGTAPARRVGFFAGEPAASRLTDNGKKLLDAAIDWALLP